LKLNDAGQSNGEQELFVNGQSVLHITGLEIAADPSTKIYGIMAQTFFVSPLFSWPMARLTSRVDLTLLGLPPVIRISGSRISRWPSLHDCLRQFFVYSIFPLGFFNVTLAPGGQSRHASYAIRRESLDGIAFVYVHDEETDIQNCEMGAIWD
jgi:hypothetical protein